MAGERQRMARVVGTACAVYAANDVEIYTVRGDDDYYLSTPELSFAIRHLRAHGG